MKRRAILGGGILVLMTGLLPVAGLAQEGAQQPGAQQPNAQQDVVVQVKNHNWLDMHVYVSRSGGPLRSLGMVTSMSAAEFRLPAEVAMAGADLRIATDPIGGSGLYVSPTMLVAPGSEIRIVVENALGLSYATVVAHPDASPPDANQPPHDR